MHRAGRGFDSRRLHVVHASVVSTASTRPLYGRGAGSTPAGGSASQRTLVAQRTRAPPCEGGGRWFESSRCTPARPLTRRSWCCGGGDSTTGTAPEAPVPRAARAAAEPGSARREPPRSVVAMRGRSSSGQSTGAPLRRGPFESGRPLSLEGPWCNGKHGELQPRWSGFDSWGACCISPNTTRRGPERLGYLMDRGSLGSHAVRSRDPTAHHDHDTSKHCGPEGSGYRLRIDRTRVRVPPGALRAPVAQWVEQFRASHTTAAASSPLRGPDWSGYRGRAPGVRREVASSSLARGGRAAPVAQSHIRPTPHDRGFHREEGVRCPT